MPSVLSRSKQHRCRVHYIAAECTNNCGLPYFSCGYGPCTHFTWRGSKICLRRTSLTGHVYCNCCLLLLVPGFSATSSRTMPSRSVVAVLLCSLCVVANVKHSSFPKAPIIARKVRCLEFNDQELRPREYEVPGNHRHIQGQTWCAHQPSV